MTVVSMVSVIVPTTASRARAEGLFRALRSVFDQGPIAQAVVVINGPSVDPDVREALQQDSRLRVTYNEEANIVAAHRVGRQLVDTPYFCFLDDDDELLTGSVALRLARAQASDAPDVVVINGVRTTPDREVPIVDRLPADDAPDLFLRLLADNWFGSCAGLFRSATVSNEYFSTAVNWLEWTVLASKLLAARRRFAFVESKGYRVHDTPGSASKALQYMLAYPDRVRAMLALDSSPQAKRLLRQRLAHAYHSCADLHLQRGEYAAAWRSHWASVCMLEGIKFIPYTRRLIWPRARGAPIAEGRAKR
jgi:glycosyltransferase involved in cell wall biosynthesis